MFWTLNLSSSAQSQTADNILLSNSGSLAAKELIQYEALVETSSCSNTTKKETLILHVQLLTFFHNCHNIFDI